MRQPRTISTTGSQPTDQVHQLLLCCARTKLDAVTAAHIVELLQQEIDWITLFNVSLRHGMTPLLYCHLNDLCPHAPNDFIKRVRDAFYITAADNLFLADELLKVLNLLEANQISAIPFKGPVLAVSVYGNLALRGFRDLDILVHESDYLRAQRLLIARKYRLTKQFDWESTFVDSSGRVAVDLHNRITPPEFPSPLSFEYVSKRLQRISFAGAQVPNLCPEDTLLMLAIQITKDAGSHYFQLAKICDIAELLRAHPCLDLAQALEQARRLGGERMLLFSLHLSNNLLGTKLPQDIVCKIPFHPSMHKFAEYAQQQLFYRGAHIVRQQATVDQFRWFIRERLRDKLSPYYVRYVKHVITPSVSDRRLLHLPNQLSFLYYFIRPIRLVGKYGSASVLGAVNWGSRLLLRLVAGYA
jgi:Uncharacterised nucleotidyltransferase